MQRGACEALWLSKPIITSDWPILQTYFAQGTVYVANTSAAIRSGVLEMRRHHERFQQGIVELQARRQAMWDDLSLPALLALLPTASLVEEKSG